MFVFLCMQFFFFTVSFAAESEFAQVKHITLLHYKSFLANVLDHDGKRIFHLQDNDTLENCTLGDPLALMELSIERTSGKLTKPQSLLRPLPTYYFPVFFNGRLKLFITVDKFNAAEPYEISSVGYSWLASELDSLFALWPKKKGYQPVLAIHVPSQMYAVWIPQAACANLTLIDPLGRTRSLYRNLCTVEETLSMMSIMRTHFP